MNGFTFLAGIIGGAIGYLIFYLRYEHKDTINQLRHHLKEVSNENQDLHNEHEELIKQNEVLKEEVTRLLEKNDDLTDVVTELSKYYVHIKKAAEKTSELTKFLQDPSPDIEEKIASFSHITKNNEEKKFF